jgi:hypothetical protein
MHALRALLRGESVYFRGDFVDLRLDAPAAAAPGGCPPAKLRAYRELGREAFILSGYPHLAEGDLFARHVLPHLDHGALPRPGSDDPSAREGVIRGVGDVLEMTDDWRW